MESYDEPNKKSTKSLFNEWYINLFDDEVVRIAKSQGIIGLNFDQRIMSSKDEMKKVRSNLTNKEMLMNWSKLIWNNIKYIAELLDKYGLNAWDSVCIGSDFDGIINPINGFWTEEEMPLFEKYLKKHVYNYLGTAKLIQNNKLAADEIVSKVMKNNAMTFLKNNFKN